MAPKYDPRKLPPMNDETREVFEKLVAWANKNLQHKPHPHMGTMQPVWLGAGKLANHLLTQGKPPRRPAAFSDGTAYAKHLATTPLLPRRNR